MPPRLRKPCAHQGCRELTSETYCELHKKQTVQQYNRQRGSAHARGYDNRWQRYRITFLRSNPLCKECERNNRLTPASVIDHIKPHKGDQALFWEVKNHQSLCKSCHDAKTAREDGGFGR